MKRIVVSTLKLSAILSVFLIGQVPLKIWVENFVIATMEKVLLKCFGGNVVKMLKNKIS